MPKQNPFMTFSNRIMAWILRSRYHSMMSRSTLLVSVHGRKTGKLIQTPVNYLRMDGSLYTTSSRNRTWWRNLREGKDCTLWLEGKEVSAHGTSIETPAEVQPLLVRYLQVSPESAKFLGVQISPDGVIDPHGLESAAQQRVLIRFDLNSDSL
jgi:hypothetical protein